LILVDTTVWIDFFAARSEPHVAALEKLIEKEEDLCLCGIILAEVLQGIRSEEAYIKTKDYLDDLVFLPMQQATFIRAAEVYRSLRRRGVTIRKPVDCMIASVAIEHDIPLLHNDRDFEYMAKYSNLRVCV
jgi:predicted nucleic acid-binding protein